MEKALMTDNVTRKTKRDFASEMFPNLQLDGQRFDLSSARMVLDPIPLTDDSKEKASFEGETITQMRSDRPGEDNFLDDMFTGGDPVDPTLETELLKKLKSGKNISGGFLMSKKGYVYWNEKVLFKEGESENPTCVVKLVTRQDANNAAEWFKSVSRGKPDPDKAPIDTRLAIYLSESKMDEYKRFMGK